MLSESHPTVKCPSCSKPLIGSYCHACGERVFTDKSHLRVTNFARNAAEDLFDIDSKYLRTFRYLLFRPGFLTKEALAGRNIPYVKPFRLYMTLVVIHFLIMSMSRSGDFFQVDRFPAFKVFPALQNMVSVQERASGLDHEAYSSQLSQQLKDNLSVLIYAAVFGVALGLMLLFRSFSNFYVEHLYFAFHIFSFSFLRNLLAIPLMILTNPLITMIFTIVTQVVYVFFAVKAVYPQRLPQLVVKTFLVLLLLTIALFGTFLVSLFVSFYQMEPGR